LTPIPTSTPLPKPDAQAMIKWKDLDLPDGFYAVPPETEEIQKGTIALSLQFSDGSTVDYSISGSFVFIDGENPSQIIYGYAFPLTTSKHRDGFDTFTKNYLKSTTSAGYNIAEDMISTIPGANDIGDFSTGVTAPYISSIFGTPWQFSNIAFRVDDIGVFVFVRNDMNVESPIDINKVAQVYADSIQHPYPSCRLVSVEPDTSSQFPTFIFEADGFYPRDSRIISLSGNLLFGDELSPLATMKMGFGGESADENGNINESISIYPEEDVEYFVPQESGIPEGVPQVPPGPIEYTLNIKGTLSGCEIEEIVVWPGD
jgi:hypothetical protein